MTRDEIVTALRCVSAALGDGEPHCKSCPFYKEKTIDTEWAEELGINRWSTCDYDEVGNAAADLIENQQRHIESLMKANDSLKDAVVRKEDELVKYRAGDVAPVIRCRDCRFYLEGQKLAPMKFCYRMGGLNRGPEDYCSRAERRDDDADQR